MITTMSQCHLLSKLNQRETKSTVLNQDTLHSKEIVIRIEKNPADWEKMVAPYTPEKWLSYNTYQGI